MARKFKQSFEVCTCKHVTLGELIYTIKEKKAKSLEDLAKLTDAGTCCKSCKRKENDIRGIGESLYLDEIIEKFTK